MKRKPTHNLFLVLGVILYGLWSWFWPMAYLRNRYAESGLTWGIMVFWIMIPYLIYFAVGIFRDKQGANEGRDQR